jgi:serine phosphatase RsbU (regulator of sigma subunit)
MEKSVEMDGLARTHGYHRFEWMHRKLDGEVFPVEVTLNAVEIDGKPAWLVVWHDLTEIKRVEAELRQRSLELEALNQELRTTNERLRRDLRAAARIQQALLPATLPDTAPVHLAWTFRPCEELAGDLLNIFLLDDRRVGFYVLDLSGHGVAASLLSVTVSHFLSPYGDTSLLKTRHQAGRPGGLASTGKGPLAGTEGPVHSPRLQEAINSPCDEGALSSTRDERAISSPRPREGERGGGEGAFNDGAFARPSEVLKRLNAQLCSERSEQFLTVFYGILDFTTYTFLYANAGHPFPIVLSEQSGPRELQTAGFPVGIVEGAEYEDVEVHLDPGNRFWLYSDGLVEAMNPAGEQFGKPQLFEAIEDSRREALTDSVRQVVRGVELWTGDQGPQDDISLVVFDIGQT